MKRLALFLLLLISFNGFGQQSKEKKDLVKGQIVDYKITQVIYDKTDTSVYFGWGFQNQHYEHITDIGTILLFDKSDIELLINSIREITQKENGVTYEIELNDKCKLNIYDFANNSVYFSDTKDGLHKYTTLSKKNAIKLADELSSYLYLFD